MRLQVFAILALVVCSNIFLTISGENVTIYRFYPISSTDGEDIIIVNEITNGFQLPSVNIEKNSFIVFSFQIQGLNHNFIDIDIRLLEDIDLEFTFWLSLSADSLIPLISHEFEEISFDRTNEVVVPFEEGLRLPVYPKLIATSKLDLEISFPITYNFQLLKSPTINLDAYSSNSYQFLIKTTIDLPRSSFLESVYSLPILIPFSIKPSNQDINITNYEIILDLTLKHSSGSVKGISLSLNNDRFKVSQTNSSLNSTNFRLESSLKDQSVLFVDFRNIHTKYEDLEIFSLTITIPTIIEAEDDYLINAETWNGIYMVFFTILAYQSTNIFEIRQVRLKKEWWNI